METTSRYLLTFLLNSLWQIPLIAAVAALACRWMRRGPAGHRHAVWMAALLAGVLLPLVSVRSSAESPGLRLTVPDAALAANGPSIVRARPAAASPASASTPRTISFARTTAAALVSAYLLFLLYGAAKFAWSWRRTIGIRRGAAGRAMPPAVADVWERCLEAFGLTGVELLCSPRVSSPVAAGTWRKIIILPEALWAETSREVLTTAIGHEMAHLARHDFAWRLAGELLYLPVAFHPAARFVRREIERTREMACDELVTSRLLDAGVYARSIVSIAAAMTGLPRPGYTLGVFDADILEERIRRLIDRPVTNLKRARLLLASGLAALAVCAVMASGLALSARAQGGAYVEMKLAADAYNSGDFKTAVQHFENAVRLAPTNVNAKLFLANALMREFFAEQAPPDSPLIAGARQQYLDAVAQDPRNKLAIQGLIAVAMNTRQLREALEWARRRIQLDPQDKSGFYAAGVVDWATVYPEFTRAKLAAGARPEEYAIPDAGVRKNLRDRFLPQVEDGLRMLQAALQLDPNYDDAMAYLNLMYRLKAGLVDSPAESAELIAAADDWVRRALAAKRKRGKSGQTGPPQLDVDAPAPGPADAPPPPPPRRELK